MSASFQVKAERSALAKPGEWLQLVEQIPQNVWIVAVQPWFQGLESEGGIELPQQHAREQPSRLALANRTLRRWNGARG